MSITWVAIEVIPQLLRVLITIFNGLNDFKNVQNLNAT